ncbi:type II toxin-antitoxin system PemK/MazF family toxin [candidate division NPL-UPA2 bacterium]|nr:type II toxin-antitoxin system PemK/MazF family toxin [candidate division NPL-UPA2 bacterium]
MPRRSEIYLVDFGARPGAKIQKVRPALIIQNDTANELSATTIVAAIRSNLEVTKLPVGVLIKGRETGLDKDSAVDLGHIQTIDKRRLGRFIGRVPNIVMEKIDRAIKVSLGLEIYRM